MLVVFVSYGCGNHTERGSDISVRNYQHAQWGEVIHIANGAVEAVVAPERGGRVMHYSRVGESNLLWTAPDINSGLGDMWGWRNWGGEKTWLWPQDDWPDVWPPPVEIEQKPWDVDSVSNYKSDGIRSICVLMTLETRFGKMMRVVRMSEGGTELVMFAFLAGGTNNLSVWSVTQIPVPEVVGVGRVEPRRLLLRMPDAEDGVELVMRDEKTFDFATTPGGTKGMLDADTFRIPTAQGMFVVRQQLDGDTGYDDVYRAQVCKINEMEGDAYVELEFAAPLPGKGTSTQMVTFSLE